MRKSLIILLLISNFTLADNTMVSKEKMKSELKTILKKVKHYKSKKEREIERLTERLNSLQKDFKKYKIKKHKELRSYKKRSGKEIYKLKVKLKNSNGKLSVNKKNYQKVQQKNKSLQKKIKIIKKVKKREKVVLKQKIKDIQKEKSSLQKKITTIKQIKKRDKIVIKRKVKSKPKVKKRDKIVLKKKVQIDPVIISSYTSEVKPRNQTTKESIDITTLAKKNLSWVEVIVDDNINIYELALRYYGDKRKYREIYVANQNIIGKNLKIYNGMSLKIPMEEQFEEQPMILNRD